MDNPEMPWTRGFAHGLDALGGSEALRPPRATCYRCFRPRDFCYCELLPRVDNRTSVIILQHPRERFHPIGTARIAQLALQNCRVEVDHARCFSDGRRDLDLPSGTGLLYPEAPSRLLHEVPPDERPKHLLLLDGTWHHARCMFRDVPGLAQLPRYRLAPPAPSQYRLRKEPTAEFVSTIEAVTYCLRILEPENREAPRLLDVFRELIDRQLRARDAARAGRSLNRRREKRIRRFPRAFAEDFEHVVAVFAEAPAGLLTRVSAVRLRDASCFDAIIRTGRSLDPYYVDHMGILPDAVENGINAETARQLWAGFIDREDVLAAWNHSTLDPLRDWCAPTQRRVSLKAAYRALDRRALGPRASERCGGSLDDIVAAEALPVVPIALRGRAGQRLGNAVALCKFLHRLATDRGT